MGNGMTDDGRRGRAFNLGSGRTGRSSGVFFVGALCLFPVFHVKNTVANPANAARTSKLEKIRTYGYIMYEANNTQRIDTPKHAVWLKNQEETYLSRQEKREVSGRSDH